MMRIAAIDIGTNTILLLVAEGEHGRITRVLDDRSVIARLGKGVDGSRRILPDTMDRCETFLADYARVIEAHTADIIRATGTSALRDAANRNDFIERIRKTTNIQIELLSGDEEARWSYIGATSGFHAARKAFAVLDIGGGSTELILGRGDQIRAHHSADIGSVRLTERFLRATPPSDAQFAAFDAFLRPFLERFPSFDGSETSFIAVAGTATTLAAVDLELRHFDAVAIAGHRMPRTRVEELVSRMRRMSEDELRSVMRVDPGRSDIILAGALILLRVMEHFRVEEMIVSERGLRYGIVIRELRAAASATRSLRAV